MHNTFTKEQFTKYAILHSRIGHLQKKKHDIVWKAKDDVKEYIKKHAPHYYHENKYYDIDFEYRPDGISVSFQANALGFGHLNDSDGRLITVRFRLNYECVFGWNVEDWNKPPCTKSEANQVVLECLNEPMYP